MSSREKARSGFAALRAARASGKKQDYKPQEDTAIYDEVDEDTYKDVVKGRLMEDDFVVDEDGDVSGYADNGMDDWDRGSGESEEEDEHEREEKESRKRAKLEKAAAATKAAAKRKAATRPVIQPGANPYINPNRASTSQIAPLKEQEDDFMNSLLGGLEGKSEVKVEEKIISREVYKPKVSFGGAGGGGRKAQPQHLRGGLASSSSEFSKSSDGESRRSGADTQPSSDGFAGTSTSDEDLGGMGEMDFPMNDNDASDYVKKEEEDADGDLSMSVDAPAVEDDEDEVLVKPGLPAPALLKKGSAAGTGALRPPPPKRQLVNVTSAKPVVVPPPVAPEPTPAPVLSTLLSAPKAVGTNWKTATASLASSANQLILSSFDDDEEELKQPETLKNPKARRRDPEILVDHVEALEEDGSLRFWWFDFWEPGNGALILVGKVKGRSLKGGNAGKEEWVSACVTVKGVRRKLYALPREKAIDSDGNVLDEDDDSPPEFDDVESDFYNDVTERWGVTNVEVTPGWVKKKYAFGIKGIPRDESDWLEATCDFPQGDLDNKAPMEGVIPNEASGERYSHIFGASASPFELFVIDRKIMGPCWLNLKAPKIINRGVVGMSWTRLEVEIPTSDISIFSNDDPLAPKVAPPLTIMSLSLRTVVNLKNNKREVVCASTRIWQDALVDDPTPIDKQPSSVYTLVRPLFTSYPNGFEAAVRKVPTILSFEKEKDEEREKALLTKLLTIILKSDPDVIVGQDFTALELDVLLNRMKELKVENWSRIGRRRGLNWRDMRATRNAPFLGGRLICDLSSDGSKSIIDSTTWSLTEMCLTHLKVTREDIDPEDFPTFFDNTHSTARQLLDFVGHCEADCYFQMAIAFKVQALPLTRQLTNLAGNSWNKTLAGNRAERNEFILLHRFNEKGYICPDKISSWEKKAQKASEAKAAKAKAKAAGEEEVTVVASKEKYKGGLVFDPKKGLWDRFVLVMDFNSLYPSIIQEYDIDFSTIDWTADDAEDLEKMPDRGPCAGEPQGILPQLIAFLVDRRRNVKKLMKEKNVTPARMMQYDITQKALKLTANSMYGCLGFEGSRFYARPLAALTTFKGREILTQTKADAESLSLDVIYGDTDSVMINTDQTDIQEAHRIGNEFKKLINEKYKKLEIDTDAVFACMLLLAKKKYAALKVEDSGERTLEVKGLDMKRREYCELSKNVSKTTLDFIMSGRPTEDVVTEIHEHLTTLGEQVRAGRIPLEQYIIYKRLGKNPQDYPDAKSQPHVSVALKMKARGQSAKAGDVIPYIFCLPDTGVSTTRAQAANAYHPDDVRRAGSTLKIDFEVYLTNQILPPIERLCDPIEGTEKARLAECLGLDAARFKSSTNELPEREFKTLQSQISDKERFALSSPLHVRCRNCASDLLYDGFENSNGLLSPYGIFCSNPDCAQPISTPSIAVQLELQIRSFITKFYECWLVCDDASCGHRTRMMSVYGKRCLSAGCRGQAQPEYSDTMLYNQLLFFDSLFDTEKALAKVSGSNEQPAVQSIIDANKTSFTQLRAVIQKHLDKNGRRWVSMSSLFSFFTPTK